MRKYIVGFDAFVVLLGTCSLLHRGVDGGLMNTPPYKVSGGKSHTNGYTEQGSTSRMSQSQSQMYGISPSTSGKSGYYKDGVPVGHHTNGYMPYVEKLKIIYGTEIIDPNMMKFMQPNTVGRDLKYDDFSKNDGYLCARDCCKYNKPRLCYFQFTLEQYSAMGAACKNCTLGNQTDCMRRDCVPADGIERTVMSINRMIPGPSIQVCLGDRVVVDVSNMILSGATAIHWHGIRQYGTPFMDGVPLVTQCPIGPTDGLFRYDWVASNSGTHLYHSHSGRQMSDGIHGSIVIRACKDVNKCNYDFDLPSHTLIVEDWTHYLSDSFYPGYYLNASHIPIKPDSYLCNGHGSYSDSRTQTTTPHQKFHVKPGGYRYLFRIIAATSSTCQFRLGFEDHDMTIVAMDGFPCKPTTVSTVTMGSGQRLDVIIKTKHKHTTTCSYNIVIKGIQICFNTTSPQTAYLVYEGCPSVVPTSKVNLATVYNKPPFFDDTELGCDNENVICSYKLETVLPHPKSVTSREPDRTIFLHTGAYQYDYDEAFHNKKGIRYPQFHLPAGGIGRPTNRTIFADSINGVVGIFPPVPILYQTDYIPPEMICHGECNAYFKSINMTRNCPCINIVKVKLNSTTRFVMINDFVQSLQHPMHIHGHGWTVVKQGSRSEMLSNPNGYYKSDLEDVRKRPARDTIGTPTNGYAVTILYASNPGMWLMHCHFEEHLVGGMMIILQVGERDEFPRPPPNFPRCGPYLPRIANLDYYKP